MTTIILKSICIEGRYAVFTDAADLSQYAPEDVAEWTFESKAVDTGSLIRTIDAIPVKAGSPAYTLAYNLMFAAEHCSGVTGPVGSVSPDLAFWETFPTNVLLAYVGRADTTRGVSEAELEAKKKPKAETSKKPPSASGAGV